MLQPDVASASQMKTDGTRQNTLARFGAKMGFKSWQVRAINILLVAVVIGLALVPVINIIYVLATTGANNPSSDDAYFYDGFLDPVLTGTYNWSHFPLDTFLNTHSSIFPGLAYIGFAYLTHLDIYSVLYFGVILAAIKLVLIHQAFTQSDKGGVSSLTLWPVLAALVFSMAQISIFEHGFQTLQVGLAQFGLALGVWALARFPGRWKGVALAAAGGTIATLSYGSGLVTWPAFTAGMVLLGFRKLTHYAVLFVVAALAALPYLFFLVLKSSPVEAASTLVSPFNYLFIINLLGRPFANEINTHLDRISMAEWSGWVGVVLLAVAVALLWARRHTPALVKSAPALMLLIFSLLNAWQISIFRQQIAPWYTTFSMTFWIGLIGLAYLFCVNYVPRLAGGVSREKYVSLAALSWSAMLVGGIAALYAVTNLTYADKSVFLRTRAPASASTVRHYREAPTYAESTLVIWQLGDHHYVESLARPLEHNGLSVFAPHQQWALQGDFVLSNVRAYEAPGIPDIHWSPDLTSSPAPYSDYRHLNLFLHTPNSVSWAVSLPANVKQADFYSAVAISESAPLDPVSDGVRFQVYLQPEGEAEVLAFDQSLGADERHWHPLSIPLSNYAGRKITLRLTSSANGNVIHDWAMYRYPYIDLHLDKDAPVATGEDVIRPSNTDLSPDFPAVSDDDFRFDIADTKLWATGGSSAAQAAREGGAASVVISPSYFLQYNQPLNLRLVDYTHFYIRVSASPLLSRRALKLYYRLSDQPRFDEGHVMTIPMLGDENMHGYTYDLKLLELPQTARLAGIMLKMIYLPEDVADNRIQISDMRLIRNKSDAGTSPHR